MTIKVLNLSDIHFGHSRNNTKEIIKNLDTFFGNYKSDSDYTDVKLITISGDMFDTIMDSDDPDYYEVLFWLSRLISFCSKYQIKLRVLKGTPSHDWEQSKVVETIVSLNENLNKNVLPVDVKYINTLFVEHLTDLGLYILYLPDEWSVSSELTYNQVLAKLKEHHIDQVDLAIMHGMFNYQLRGVGSSQQKHDEESYLRLVKRFICVGHIHTFSTFDRIIAPGSFDRLAHGEEEPKGAVLLTLGETDSWQFIENKNAKVFKTIELKNNDREKSLALIDKVLSKIPEDSYIRIRAKKEHPLYIAFDEVKKKYFMYHLSRQLVTDKEEEQLEEISVPEYTTVDITKDNIVGMLLTAVESNHEINTQQLALLKDNLERLV